MTIEYFKRSKEEIDLAFSILKVLNDANASLFIKHLMKSMAFITDFAVNKHADFANDLPIIKKRLDLLFGADFLETYFYLDSLLKREFKVFDMSNITMSGRNVENVTSEFFRQLSNKVVNFFNTAYDLTLDGKIWT